MLLHISWTEYLITVGILSGVYYIGFFFIHMSRTKANARGTSSTSPVERDPAPVRREAWMDQVLEALEQTVKHAERKRYHPEEVIKALQMKIEELKSECTKN